MSPRPGVGESWWFNDMLLLVLGCDRMKGSVRALVLLDLDEVFNVGTTVDWRYDDQSHENAEPDRRVA